MSNKSRSNRARRRHSRRGNQPSFSDKAKRLVPLVAVPTVVLTVGYMAMASYLDAERMNESTHCYDNRVDYEVAFFVEASFNKDISDKQSGDFDQVLVNAFGDLPPNGRLSVFTTSRQAAQTVVDPVLVTCRPASSEAEQDAIGIGDKNPVQLKVDGEKALDAYRAKIQDVIRQAADPDLGANNSPIIETVRSISRYYGPGELDQLHMWTDGVNNSAARQMCVTKGHLLPYPNFPKSRDYRYLKPESLAGVAVNFWLVEHIKFPNPSAPFCTNYEIRDWWAAFMGDHGAVVDMEYLAY